MMHWFIASDVGPENLVDSDKKLKRQLLQYLSRVFNF